MMRLADYTKHLIDLGQTIYQWAGQIAEIDRTRREKVALYAEEIAATDGAAHSQVSIARIMHGGLRKVYQSRRAVTRAAVTAKSACES